MIKPRFQPFPVLTTPRLILRSLRTEDAHDLFFLRSNEEVNTFIESARHTSLEQTEAFMLKIENGIRRNEWIFWAITAKNDDRLIGTICLWNLEVEKDLAETGYVLHPDYQGRGWMSEALEAVVSFGFDELHLKDITAFTHRDNVSSTQLLLRHGFRPDPYGKIETGTQDVAYRLRRKDRINKVKSDDNK